MKWIKQCQCHAPSATGQIHFSITIRPDHTHVMTATLHSGPSCNGCGTPWAQIKEEA
jgi:hypothetical protein